MTDQMMRRGGMIADFSTLGARPTAHLAQPAGPEGCQSTVRATRHGIFREPLGRSEITTDEVVAALPRRGHDDPVAAQTGDRRDVRSQLTDHRGRLVEHHRCHDDSLHARPAGVGRRAPTCPIWWPGAEESAANEDLPRFDPTSEAATLTTTDSEEYMMPLTATAGEEFVLNSEELAEPVDEAGFEWNPGAEISGNGDGHAAEAAVERGLWVGAGGCLKRSRPL